jgi:hypothetical protein
MLSGFTLARNAVKLDFPIVPTTNSLLDVCDEVVVNVGESEDETRDLVASIPDPRVRILDTRWDFTKKNLMLSIETQRAMDACRGSWGIYIQADEVLHERGARILKEKTAEWDRDKGVEGLLVKYRHFYGGFETIATNRRWYRPTRAPKGSASDRTPVASVPASPTPRCSTTAGHGRPEPFRRSSRSPRPSIPGAWSAS